MNHSITILARRLAFAFAAIIFISSSAFAGDPIPGGISMGGGNPGGIMHRAPTDSTGTFKFPIWEAGSYTIKFTADEVKNMIAIANRLYPHPYGSPDIILRFSPSASMTVNGKRTYSAITLSSMQTTTINIILIKAVSVSGTITTGAKRNK